MLDQKKREVVVTFITQGDRGTLMEMLRKARCRICDGSGDCDDAENGDMYHRSWQCAECEGKGWNTQAVEEMVAAVPDFVFEGV